MKSAVDQYAEISAVEPYSVADLAGIQVRDRVVSVQGVLPRDILEWHRLIDEDLVSLTLLRGNQEIEIEVERVSGQPFGASINSAVFDRIHTCDNHCEFCFIYQLPKGMRRSLYLKDDDYRLSFLFGNFTTLTRFTEADLERVIDEKLSPLYVSVHATDVHQRAEMLRNNRGGVSLRWLKLLLQHNIDVRAQIVLCPGVNDGEVLEDSLSTLLDEFEELESIAIVPLGLSKFNTEARMRVQSEDEARHVLETVEKWQKRYKRILGRQPIHLADEFYLVAGVEVPNALEYGSYSMIEDGVGLVRSFIDSFTGVGVDIDAKTDGFFASVDTKNPTQYVRPMNPAADSSLRVAPVPVELKKISTSTSGLPYAVVTGSYGATMMRSLLPAHGFGGVPIVEVVNTYFGGNTAVAGLMTYEDISNTLSKAGEFTFLIPDVCINDGVFLDGGTVNMLSERFSVEVISTRGAVLRKYLEANKKEVSRV